MKIQSKMLLTAAIVAAASCRGSVEQQPIDQQQAEKIADQYAERFMINATSKVRTQTLNGGKSWVVMYEPESKAFGGTSFVVVHKVTKEVVAEFGYP